MNGEFRDNAILSKRQAWLSIIVFVLGTSAYIYFVGFNSWIRIAGLVLWITASLNGVGTWFSDAKKYRILYKKKREGYNKEELKQLRGELGIWWDIRRRNPLGSKSLRERYQELWK